MEVEEDNNLVLHKDNLDLNMVENNLVLHKVEVSNVVQHKADYYNLDQYMVDYNWDQHNLLLEDNHFQYKVMVY